MFRYLSSGCVYDDSLGVSITPINSMEFLTTRKGTCNLLLSFLKEWICQVPETQPQASPFHPFSDFSVGCFPPPYSMGSVKCANFAFCVNLGGAKGLYIPKKIDSGPPLIKMSSSTLPKRESASVLFFSKLTVTFCLFRLFLGLKKLQAES